MGLTVRQTRRSTNAAPGRDHSVTRGTVIPESPGTFVGIAKGSCEARPEPQANYFMDPSPSSPDSKNEGNSRKEIRKIYAACTIRDAAPDCSSKRICRSFLRSEAKHLEQVLYLLQLQHQRERHSCMLLICRLSTRSFLEPYFQSFHDRTRTEFELVHTVILQAPTRD